MRSWEILTTATHRAPASPWPRAAAALLACLAAIFFVPYLIPVRPSPSISAMAGFSNTAALALLVLCAALFGWQMRNTPLTFPVTANKLNDRRSRLLLVAVMIALGVICLLLWLAQRGKGGVGELTFFGPLYENYRLGQHFYRDLDFPYGPLLAYGPIVAARFTGLTLFDGYHLAWLVQSVAGAALTFKTVDLLGMATTARARIVFLLVTSFFYVQLYSEGLQYTPVRFLAAPLLALYVVRRYRGPAAPWTTFLLAGIGNAGILFYSPEHGIQFFLGTLLFFGMCTTGARRLGTWTGLALFTGIFSVSIAIAGSMGMLGFFLRTSGGALNLPLLPGLPTVAAVLFLLGSAVVALAARQQHRFDHPWVYLVALSLITLPVALGRCDPGHIFVNTIGAFLAVLAALSYRRGWFLAACLLFCCIVGRDLLKATTSVLPSIVRDGLRQAVTEPTPLHGLARRYDAYLVRHNGAAAAQAMQREHRLSASVQPGLPLPQGTVFFAPFGATLSLPRPAGDPHIFTGSYPGHTIYASYAEAEKRRGMTEDSHRFILMPTDWQGECVVTDRSLAATRSSLQWIFQTPLVPRLHATGSPWQPFCAWFVQNYRLTPYASPLQNMQVYQAASR